MKATKVNAGLAESSGRLLLGLWRDSLHVTCGLTACTPGSAPGPTLGNEYGKTLPLPLPVIYHNTHARTADCAVGTIGESVHVCRVQFWSCRSGSTCCTTRHQGCRVVVRRTSGHTHTHTPFNGRWSGTTRVGRYRKKTHPLTPILIIGRPLSAHYRKLSLKVTLLLHLSLG